MPFQRENTQKIVHNALAAMISIAFDYKTSSKKER